ncbi:MAG: hypothetical protein K1Y36_02315 [Blastocatellia bacterium]|nr:hypothetical protein [Blastocatellia bacterium]
MAIRITQVYSPESSDVQLRIEGSMNSTDADLCAHICRGVLEKAVGRVIIQLENLVFLNQQGADILCWMKRQPNVKLEGCGPFTNHMLELCG